MLHANLWTKIYFQLECRLFRLGEIRDLNHLPNPYIHFREIVVRNHGYLLTTFWGCPFARAIMLSTQICMRFSSESCVAHAIGGSAHMLPLYSSSDFRLSPSKAYPPISPRSTF